MPRINDTWIDEYEDQPKHERVRSDDAGHNPETAGDSHTATLAAISHAARQASRETLAN